MADRLAAIALYCGGKDTGGSAALSSTVQVPNRRRRPSRDGDAKMDMELFLIGAIVVGLAIMAGGLLWQKFAPKRQK